MEFLYKIQPNRVEMLSEGLTPNEQAIVDQHFNYLEDLSRQGTVLLAGRILTADANTFGIVIYRAETLEAAVRIMEHDPAVMQGVMRAELFPFAWL